MQLLYPSSPLRKGEPDEQFADEVAAVRAAGFQVSLFSLENLQAGTLRAIPPLPSACSVLYRGWMMSASEYEAFDAKVRQAGARLATNTPTYLASHYLPNWYPLISELTPETRIFPADCDLVSELRSLDWSEFFVKDYVKSLKTAAGSRITQPEQAAALVSDMRRFRGQIEGGFCVRRVEALLPETERRFFVLNGTPYSDSGEVPAIVRVCIERLRSSFFSVDVVQRSDGQLRVVEIGDGQVSDLVGWTPQRFTEVLAAEFQP